MMDTTAGSVGAERGVHCLTRSDGDCVDTDQDAGKSQLADANMSARSTCLGRKINQLVDVVSRTMPDVPDMRRVKLPYVVKAPCDEVFRAWTDYQAWPKFSVIYSRVKVAYRDPNRAHLEAEVRVRHGHLVGIDHPRGRVAIRREQHELTPPERVEVTADSEGAISTSVWKFEPVPDGTLITADVYAPVRGVSVLLGTIVRRTLKSLLSEELQAFAKYVEAKQERRLGSARVS